MSEKPQIRTVNAWMNSDVIGKGFTFANAKFKKDYHDLRIELRRRAALLYFLAVDLEIHYLSKMMYSAKKQAHFCGAVVKMLDDKKVEDDHIKVFRKNVKDIKKRLDTIDRIIKLDIHLTEYEPFFEAEIWTKDIKDPDLIFEDIPKRAKSWNEEHPDIVKAHLEAIQPELERHQKFLEEKRAKLNKEKEDVRKAKQEQKEYEDEIINNRKKNRAEYNRIERSFERYYEGRA